MKRMLRGHARSVSGDCSVPNYFASVLLAYKWINWMFSCKLGWKSIRLRLEFIALESHSHVDLKKLNMPTHSHRRGDAMYRGEHSVCSGSKTWRTIACQGMVVGLHHCWRWWIECSLVCSNKWCSYLKIWRLMDHDAGNLLSGLV